MRPGVVVVVLMLVLGATACGDDDDGSDSGGALSGTEFARRANALCAEAAADRRTVLSGTETTELTEETAEQLDEIVAIDEKLLTDVDDLVPPDAEQDTVDQLLDQWRDRIDFEQQARAATAAGDQAQLSSLQTEIESVDAQANQIAGTLLLNQCTRGQS